MRHHNPEPAGGEGSGACGGHRGGEGRGASARLRLSGWRTRRGRTARARRRREPGGSEATPGRGAPFEHQYRGVAAAGAEQMAAGAVLGKLERAMESCRTGTLCRAVLAAYKTATHPGLHL
eukprot:3331156-Pleurochrysis_carterae.AAC.4